MKILHVINGLGSGGAERLVSQLAPLMNMRNQCDVLVLSIHNAVFLDTLLACGVNVETSPYQSIYDLRQLLFLQKKIRQGSYDIVHAHIFPTIYWISVVARLCGHKTKFVMTEHNTHNRRRNKSWLKPLEKYIYRRYNFVISISNETQQNLLNWLNPTKKQKEKYLAIPNGISVDIFKKAEPLSRDELKVPSDVVLLGMVGSFSKKKNHATLLRALPLLPQHVHILFAGTGFLLEETIALVQTLGVEKRAHFLGFRSDVERIMKTVDLFVLPSLWEGFGLVAVEAMACGKPVAVSDVPGVREVVGDCGVLFDPNDPNDMAQKISSILDRPELYSRYVNLAKMRADNFSIEKMAAKYMEVYEKLLKGG